MRIRTIELTRFGPHQNTRLEGIGDGLTVIYGPNEAGKSSLLAAVRGVLFGRTGGAEPDVSGTTGASGRLVVDADEGPLAIERTLGAKRPPKLVLTNGDSASGDAQLREQIRALARIDESIYRSVFTFQLAELNDLSDQESLAGQMYAAGLIGKASPMLIEQQLHEQARSLFIPDRRAKKPPLNECLAQIEDLKAQAVAAADKPDDYLHVQAEAEQLQTQAEELHQKQQALTQTLADLQKDFELLPVHRKLIADRASLQDFAHLPALDKETEQVLQSAAQSMSRIRESLSELHGEQEELGTKAEELDALFRQLSPGWTAEVLEGLHVDESLRGHVADLQERWSDLVRQRDRTHEALDSARAALARLRKEVPQSESSLEQFADEIADRLAAMAEQFAAAEADENRLRRLEALANEARGLAAQAALADSQRQTTTASPAGWLILAVVLVLAAVYSAWQGGYVAALVMAAAAGVLFFRSARRPNRPTVAGDGEASSGVDPGLAQEATGLANQLVMAQLPGAPLELTAAQWMNVYEALRQTTRAIQTGTERLKEERQAVLAAKEAEAQVAEWSRKADSLSDQQAELASEFARVCQEIGLTMPVRTPAALGAELNHAAHWQTAHRQLKRAQGHLAERRQILRDALATVADTVTGLSETLGVMAETAAAQHGGDVQPAPDLEGLAVMLEQRLTTVRTVFDAGQEDLATQHQRAEELRRNIDQMVSRAVGLCGSAKAYEARAANLDQATPEGLEVRIGETREQLQSVRAELASCQQAYGVLTAKLQAWSGEDSARVAWDLAQAKSHRAELAEHWAVLTLAQALVHEARTRFEKERQPAVLTGAGQLLCEWTAGRYAALQARTDTSGKPHIVCLDDKGEAWDPMRLSRGTREQVYLCLRLAMIQDYREKGIELPVILDDPMVNFDAVRLNRALSFLARHAGDSQWIYLTCQDHVAHSAQELGARVLRMAGGEEKTLTPMEG